MVFVYLPPAAGDHTRSAYRTFDQTGKQTDSFRLNHLLPPGRILPSFFLYPLPFFCNNRLMHSFNHEPLFRIRFNQPSIFVFLICPPAINKLSTIDRIIYYS